MVKPSRRREMAQRAVNEKGGNRTLEAQAFTYLELVYEALHAVFY